jgi:transcriptional regulator with XRE-family HTH domain
MAIDALKQSGLGRSASSYAMNSRALKLLRQYHRLTQAELAERLSLSKSFISELEAGNRRPSIDVLEKYAENFKLPLSGLMLFSEQIDAQSWHDRSRVVVADKVLKMLEWLEETTNDNAAENSL